MPVGHVLQTAVHRMGGVFCHGKLKDEIEPILDVTKIYGEGCEIAEIQLYGTHLSEDVGIRRVACVNE